MAHSLFQSSESLDGCKNMLEMVQWGGLSKSEKANQTSHSVVDG